MSFSREVDLVWRSVDLSSFLISSSDLEITLDSPITWRRIALIMSSSVRWKRESIIEEVVIGGGRWA